MISAGGTVNGANYAKVVAPGSIASVYGSFLLDYVTSASSVPLPTSLSGLSLQFGGVRARFFMFLAAE